MKKLLASLISLVFALFGCTGDEGDPPCDGFRLEPRLQVILDMDSLVVKATSQSTDTVTNIFSSGKRRGVLAIDMNSDSMNLVLETDTGRLGVLHLDYSLKPKYCSSFKEFNLYFDSIMIRQTSGVPVKTIAEYHLGLQPFDSSKNYAPWINKGQLILSFN